MEHSTNNVLLEWKMRRAINRGKYVVRVSCFCAFVSVTASGLLREKNYYVTRACSKYHLGQKRIYSTVLHCDT